MDLPRHDDLITVGQAYRAMTLFIENYWIRGGRRDEVVDLLSDVSGTFWPDGGPNDPAQWGDFLNALDGHREPEENRQ